MTPEQQQSWEKLFSTLNPAHVWEVERIIGIALFHGNCILIAMVNAFIREHNIHISKHNVLEQIYAEDCYVNYEKWREHGALVSFYDNCPPQTYQRLDHEFWNRFR